MNFKLTICFKDGRKLVRVVDFISCDMPYLFSCTVVQSDSPSYLLQFSSNEILSFSVRPLSFL